MRQGFDRVYHIEVEERRTVVVDMLCFNCGAVNTTEGDYANPDDIVKFRPIMICYNCMADYAKEGGLIPNDRTARLWAQIAEACERQFFGQDARDCFYETVNVRLEKRQSEKCGSAKKKKPQFRYSDNGFDM